MDSIEGKILGKQVSYPARYAPELLVAVPRALNRVQYLISDTEPPFVGFDAWHAYELGFLTEKGLPVSGVLKLVYPANSPALVESKSLKLYLNSFNMERMGQNADEGIQLIAERIRQDLSLLLETRVGLCFFDAQKTAAPFDFENYQLLDHLPLMEQLVFNAFSEDPSLLTPSVQGGTLQVATHLLRSNCKITHQPDWGSAFVHLKGNTLPSIGGLMQYLVSFRNENHFHEEICEMIYKRLWDAFQPDELAVTCIYTRRGGIDICPSRASGAGLLPTGLGETTGLTAKLLRQ